ncbi:MAG: bifunctional demethylmenaquinone methyltransferase/2-methoxy-6-polyprenyl-1,4-benzoquinol methylase UbiE [Candidatus Abyssobacteria bacterium SURF_17]|uniref:Demethylmenaquinone methyltransferase n=1 Tax=Candidatus Abyssobacteria bacterium SURF_17 TaxID=2093361 RepID=A0A419ESY1_9BACT|nr:MAG: bifunctional demethylmenaquinone methyltransferase/2-methoxy-6-polyprenyl-1,4-benzoquinol methylase UbiE [Candidatus Abyssubacteria bacterium SURF_17]
MRNASEIRSMFASISRRYDFLNHLLSLNQDKRWRKEAVEMSRLSGSDLVLDVCSGTADLAIEYARKVGPSGLVVGTDFCPEMLLIGNRKISECPNGSSGRGKIALMAADTLHLPFADDTFDVASVAFGIRNVSDVKAGVTEMTRVVKEGGRVVILEFSLPEHRLVRGLYKGYFTCLLPVIGRTVSRARNDAYSYLPDSVLKFPEKGEMCEVLRECGLGDVSATELTLGIVTLYVGFKHSMRTTQQARKTSF